jgi:hypothetical protein
MRVSTLALTILLAASSAHASPLRAKNGHTIRLVLGGQRASGIGLKPAAGTWRLELARTDADSAEVVDVTSGAPASKWKVDVVDAALRFDRERFVADHAYRVELQRAGRAVGSALVYLYPAPRAGKQELTFSDGDDAGDGEIATTPKSAL